jgi:hypothetical protein
VQSQKFLERLRVAMLDLSVLAPDQSSTGTAPSIAKISVFATGSREL